MSKKFFKKHLTIIKIHAIINYNKGKEKPKKTRKGNCMTANEIRTTARNRTVAALTEVLNANHAIQFADASFAILQKVGRQEVWTEVIVRSMVYKSTKDFPAFNPRAIAEQWEADKEIKAMRKSERDAEKERKAKERKNKKKKEEEGE